MSGLRALGNELMSWTFLKTDRARQEWWDHGHKFTTLGLFDFLLADTAGNITGSIPQADLDRVARWPDTRYLLTVRNDGVLARFRAVVENAAAQDTFIGELHRILDAYPFAAGVDIDLENGPVDNPDGVVALAKRICESIKARPAQRYVAWCLPPMTGDGLPEWERWCDYRRMEPYFDSCAIMTYAFSWSGSAPGPTSPMWWLEQVYDYAVTRLSREKVHMGVPGFGFRWQIFRRPETGEYRGVALTFLGALEWQQGMDRHHASQAYVPFAGYHDPESQSPYLMPHVYDQQEGADATTVYPPAWRGSGSVAGTDIKRNYLVMYEKSPVYDFQGVLIDRAGDDYDEISGAMTVGQGWISPRSRELVWANRLCPECGYRTNLWKCPRCGTETELDEEGAEWLPEEEGLAVFNFDVPSAGSYRLVVRLYAPWWDRQKLQISLNGAGLQAGPFPDWYPLHRRLHWLDLGSHSLPEGANTLEVRGEGSQYGTQFWGFRICSGFGMTMDGGGGTYTLMPRRFKDVDGNWVLPDSFILTLEALRHAPDHAWVWYDDFRDDTLSFYSRRGGTWSMDTDPTWRVLVQSDDTSGDAQAHLAYHGFGDLDIRARLRMTSGSGTMGVVFKAAGFDDLYLFLLRRSTQTAELWRRSGGAWSRVVPDVAHKVTLGVRYTLRVRSRGSELHCWVGTTRVFNVSTSLPASGGFGIRTSNAACECSVLDAGDPYVYVPQEAIDVTPPGQPTVTLGRVARTGVTWLWPWEYFYFGGPGEESGTRTETIPLDFDLLHTSSFAAFEDDRQALVKFRDRGVWVTNLYLGDALGFSIVHYSDAEHFSILKNLAKHRWGLKGVGFWALGFQDPRVFEII